MTSSSTSFCGLYVITDDRFTPGEKLLPAVSAAIQGGARLVQYRNKSPGQTSREQQARGLLQLCHDHEVPLIINDDVGLAAAIGADGVHLGEEDMALEEARVRLGPRAIIGISCHDSLDLAIRAAHAGADYVAFGSFFASPTKPQAVRAPVSLLESARQTVNVPICAIGGITPENGAGLVKAGAHMLAVISGIFAQPDIAAAARRYAQLFT
ncbi:MAG: thiamine phosphate synthase [Gammaproteobacteria bacterium]